MINMHYKAMKSFIAPMFDLIEYKLHCVELVGDLIKVGCGFEPIKGRLLFP